MTNHQLEKDVSCKVLQFINTMKITKLLGYKTLRCTNTIVSLKEKKKLNNRLLNRQFMLIWAGCTPLIELMATTLPSQVIDQECIDPL